MIAARDDSTSPTSVTTPADDFAHLLRLTALGSWRSGQPTTALFATISPTSRGTELCERDDADHHDEGPVDAAPRNQDGTRHAGLPGLIHAPPLLTTGPGCPFHSDSHTPLIRLFREGLRRASPTTARRWWG